MSRIEKEQLADVAHAGVSPMVYKKGNVERAFTCELKIEGLTQNAPPSIARAYQNGVIRVDDYLVAVNGTVRARGAARPTRACACTRANTLYTTRVTTRIPPALLPAPPPPRLSRAPRALSHREI